MEHVEQVLAQATTFIQSKDFFYYHGLVMSLLWFFASPIGIILRKVSVYLHAVVFFLIDVTAAFFIVGALIRVYPYFGYFTSWSLIKQAHISAGCLFLALLLLQHVGGVQTLLRGQTYNGQHRQFGHVVSNLGRIIATFGLILAQAPQAYIVGASVLAFVFLALTLKKIFPKAKPQRISENATPTSEGSRHRSPPRDVKRD